MCKISTAVYDDFIELVIWYKIYSIFSKALSWFLMFAFLEG